MIISKIKKKYSIFNHTKKLNTPNLYNVGKA